MKENNWLVIAAVIGGGALLLNKSKSGGGSIFDNLSSFLGSLGGSLSSGLNSLLNTIGIVGIPDKTSANSANTPNDPVNLAAATMDYKGQLSIPYSAGLAGILDKNFIITSTGVTTQLVSMDQVIAIASTQSYAKPTTLENNAIRPTENNQAVTDAYAQYLAANPDIAAQYVKLNSLG